MKTVTQSLPGLASLAAGRDFLQTDEFARVFGRKAHTARKNYCLQGHSWGIKPIRRGGRLLWPVQDIESALNEGGAE